MDVSQLRTLIHVAELGSLSKAADRLHIAQPALSRQIRLLEQELGVRLFSRHGRGMAVTEDGENVLRRALRVMAELDDIRAVVSDGGAPLRGHVSIGMPPTASDVLSEPLVSAFRAAHPDATLRIVSAYTGHLLDWLQRGDLDAAILYDPASTRTLRVQPLLEETLFLIGPSDSALSLDAPVSFAELEAKRLLLPSSGHGLRMLLDRYAREAGILIETRVEADSYSTLKTLVRNGHGLTVLPLAPIHEELGMGSLRAAPLIDPVPVRRLIMSFPADRPTPRLARFAGEAIATIVRAMVTKGIVSGRIIEPEARATSGSGKIRA